MAGPDWVALGVAKMLGGALLASLAISHSVPVDRAGDPNQMYLVAYEYVFPPWGWAVAATTLFVTLSQIKINVTNAYAGSLAWSNFFARLTHSHPGRVVWVIFNTLIMGGEMTASSILGVGTQFRIRLFLPATPESTMVSPVAVAASSSPRPGSVPGSGRPLNSCRPCNVSSIRATCAAS
jgi:hypothetical protein